MNKTWKPCVMYFSGEDPVRWMPGLTEDGVIEKEAKKSGLRQNY